MDTILLWSLVMYFAWKEFKPSIIEWMAMRNVEKRIKRLI
jgi:hypothetical protein